MEDSSWCLPGDTRRSLPSRPPLEVHLHQYAGASCGLVCCPAKSEAAGTPRSSSRFLRRTKCTPTPTFATRFPPASASPPPPTPRPPPDRTRTATSERKAPHNKSVFLRPKSAHTVVGEPSCTNWRINHTIGFCISIFGVFFPISLTQRCLGRPAARPGEVPAAAAPTSPARTPRRAR